MKAIRFKQEHGFWLLVFWLIGNVVPALAADEPEIRVATSADEIFVGESIDLQVEIRNVKNSLAPDMSAIKEQFEVIANGDECRSRTYSATSITFA